MSFYTFASANLTGQIVSSNVLYSSSLSSSTLSIHPSLLSFESLSCSSSWSSESVNSFSSPSMACLSRPWISYASPSKTASRSFFLILNWWIIDLATRFIMWRKQCVQLVAPPNCGTLSTNSSTILSLFEAFTGWKTTLWY